MDPKQLHKLLLIFVLCVVSAPAQAQNDSRGTPVEETEEHPVPGQVDVEPAAGDPEIHERLLGIMHSTGWFVDVEVEVNDGVVFLRGLTEAVEFKNWAGDLARNTQDVTAVVNQIEVMEPDIWNYEPAFTGARNLWYSVMRAIPFWIFGLLVLLLFWGISLLTAKVVRISLQRRRMNPLLQKITAKTVAVVVFLMGLYVVFHIADLTNVAFTILGGTGLLGIVLGIAFRDITENFLASIFLSVQNPFQAGDLVDINGSLGFVQRLTIRATLLMTLDGNHLQIPNATVYKSSILNFTSNPTQRTSFGIGIGYNDRITEAQEIGAEVLANHPAVLTQPEPWILVDNLAASTVELRFYFWLNGNAHNVLKVKSSVMRLVKTAYQEAGISMPGEAREMFFPDGIPVGLQEKTPPAEHKKADTPPSSEDAKIITEAEGRLQSNDDEIQEQARRSRSPESGEDLLKS